MDDHVFAYSFDAEMTIEEYDQGNLTFDYGSPRAFARSDWQS